MAAWLLVCVVIHLADKEIVVLRQIDLANAGGVSLSRSNVPVLDMGINVELGLIFDESLEGVGTGHYLPVECGRYARNKNCVAWFDFERIIERILGKCRVLVRSEFLQDYVSRALSSVQDCKANISDHVRRKAHSREIATSYPRPFRLNPVDVRSFGSFGGAIRSNNGIFHLSKLLRIDNSVGDDSNHRDRLHYRHEKIKAVFFSVAGFFLCLYSVWNMKLGPQDRRAFVALGLGLVSFIYGFSLLLDVFV